MGHIPFTRLPMDPDNAPAMLTAAAAAFPAPIIPSTTTTDVAALHYLNSRLYASLVQPAAVAAAVEQQSEIQAAPAAEAARRRRHQEKEEENASIRLVHLLITCAGAIQAGDYSVAQGNLTDARAVLKAIPVSNGIGRVGIHFADALAQRLFPAYPPLLPATPPPAPAPTATYNHFYDAGPYLKFAHATANRAILKAFEGCKRVHVIDLALLQGLQWPELMDELAKRDGGPPELRITGVGPHPTSGRDELHEVGVRLAEYARRVKVPFTFQGVCADQLDQLCDWIHFKPTDGVYEAVAVNSILQLHRLLVDPDDDDSHAAAAAAVPAPIDVVLKLVMKLKPKIFMVVEHEADHNKTQLLERFTNALFHYATMFDSLEATAAGSRATRSSSSSSHAEAYLRGEIFDIICGEGSARTERHHLFNGAGGWKERLTGAGFTQVGFDLGDANMAMADLISATSFSGSGFSILQGSGGLALAWHGRPLYVATAWHAMGEAGAAAVDHAEGGDGNYHKGSTGSSAAGGGKDNPGRRGVASGGIKFL